MKKVALLIIVAVMIFYGAVYAQVEDDSEQNNVFEENASFYNPNDFTGLYSTLQQINCNGVKRRVNRNVRVYLNQFWFCGHMINSTNCDYKSRGNLYDSSNYVYVAYLNLNGWHVYNTWLPGDVSPGWFFGSGWGWVPEQNRWCWVTMTGYKYAD